MRRISQLVAAIDRLTLTTGQAVAWLLVAMVVLQTLVVLLRYGFDIGSIALQESVVYLHACVFMLGASYALKVDGHVRVDIFYQSFSQRSRAQVNLIGSLLLLAPVCLFIFWTSLDYVQQSWSISERSADSGGLPIVYLLKTLIPAMAATLLLQALAEAGRAWLQLTDTSAAPPQ